MSKQRTGFTAWMFPADGDDAPYIAKLGDWMTLAPADLPFSRKFKWLLKGLIDTANGAPLCAPQGAVLDVEAVAAQVRDQLRGEMLDWLREVVGDGQRVQAINTLHAQGGELDDDLLVNMLADWDNGSV